METGTLLTLLTICVVLLSVVIVTMLAVLIALVIQLHKVAKNIDHITGNVASASEWLVPSKVIAEVVKVFRK